MSENQSGRDSPVMASQDETPSKETQSESNNNNNTNNSGNQPTSDDTSQQQPPADREDSPAVDKGDNREADSVDNQATGSRDTQAADRGDNQEQQRGDNKEADKGGNQDSDGARGDCAEAAGTESGDTKETSVPNGKVPKSAEEVLAAVPPVSLSEEERNSTFQQGLELEQRGEKDEALGCYLKCLLGLTEGTKFPLLPQCLRNISEIYYSKDEYEKAVSFLQAEKLYYENVLVNDARIQKQLDEEISQSEKPDSDVSIDTIRATEYEQLAKLCMDENQPRLALEYAGKAVKIRQELFGDDHPLTQQTLDYFASLYAEVGKLQYKESLEKWENLPEEEKRGMSVGTSERTVEGENSPGNTSEPVSILRRRKNAEGEKEKRVRFDESQVPPVQAMEREEKIAIIVLWMLFICCIVLLVILGSYIFCHWSDSSTATCEVLKSKLHYGVMRLRYWYYHWSSDSDNKYT